MSDYKAFHVELADKVAHVAINRPDKINAMNADFWSEIIQIFRWIDETDSIRAVVISGAAWTAGPAFLLGHFPAFVGYRRLERT